MIIDSSAIIATLLQEPGHERILEHIVTAPVVGTGAPTLTETGIVLVARLGPPGESLLARFIQEAGILPIPFTEEHWASAVTAYQRFGKGRHPAALNFGDCLTYAVARIAARPLLCTGNDFARTDLPLVN